MSELVGSIACDVCDSHTKEFSHCFENACVHTFFTVDPVALDDVAPARDSGDGVCETDDRAAAMHTLLHIRGSRHVAMF